MKEKVIMKISWKIIAILLIVATLMTTLPLTVFAEELKIEGDDVDRSTMWTLSPSTE